MTVNILKPTHFASIGLPSHCETIRLVLVGSYEFYRWHDKYSNKDREMTF